jgi:M6 family metalloprotease-like protein
VIKKIICSLYLMGIALSIFLIPQAMAGPASPDPVTLTNPGGTRFKAMIRGDEFQNWIETEEGYSIVRNPANNTWEYAEKAPDGSLQNSGIKFEPGKIAPRKVLKGLRPDRNAEAEAEHNRLLREIYQERINAAAPAGAESPAAPEGWTPVPVSGQKKVLIILINFADRTLVTTPDGWYGKIFATTAGVKSMAKYYAANSYGLVTLSPASHNQSGNPAGIITVTVSDSHPNYGKNYDITTETTILNHALAQAASYITFAGYDTNADGVIEQSELNIYFIYAGYEASGSAKTPSIWAHAWGGSITAGTKQVHKWAQNGELNNNDVQHPMGVIAHEMGHSLCGLPDLYDTSGTNSGLGIFSLMAGGSWGADTVAGEDGGTTPVNLDAWSRQYLGWATPATLPSNGVRSFPLPLSSRSSSVVLDPAVGAEYFLAENRYPTGWDLGMRSSMGSDWQGGLLILHVDNNIGTPGSNDINRYVYGSHQGVMAEEANNGVGCSLVNNKWCRGSAKILFYNGNNNAFTDASTPNSRYYDGTSSYFGLSSISVPGQTMSSTYSAIPVPPSVSANYPADNATGVGTGTTITVTFNKAMNASTINSTNFYLNNGVTGSVSYNSGNYTATLTPSVSLASNTVYTATVTTDVMDVAGTNMATAKSWNFTTADGTNLVVNGGFESDLSGWATTQVSGITGAWTTVSSGLHPADISPHGGTTMARFNSFSAPYRTQTRLYQTSGFVISSSAVASSLSFWMSHDTDYSSELDELQVQVSTNGGSSWNNVGSPVIRYDGTTGWSQVTLDLSAYKGQSDVRIGFLGISHWGNDIYLDDVKATVTHTLTLNFAGSGSGTVTINPLSTSCNVNCSKQVASGTALTLHATPGDYSSTFSGWSGNCSGAGDCALNMNADKNVISTFTHVPPVRLVGGGNYDSFQTAYIAAAASCTILAKAVEMAGDFTANLGKTVLLEGGYDSVYSSNSGGYTVINGKLTIQSGCLMIENLAIR